ncbi:MAG TPA: hypothetical protein VK861_10765, partial [Bacteroidales bacterium]|nr:hypothetical protein [Bacteroidales bacterium]
EGSGVAGKRGSTQPPGSGRVTAFSGGNPGCKPGIHELAQVADLRHVRIMPAPNRIWFYFSYHASKVLPGHSDMKYNFQNECRSFTGQGEPPGKKYFPDSMLRPEPGDSSGEGVANRRIDKCLPAQGEMFQ